MLRYVNIFLKTELTCIPQLIRKYALPHYNNAISNGIIWVLFIWFILHYCFTHFLGVSFLFFISYIICYHDLFKGFVQADVLQKLLERSTKSVPMVFRILYRCVGILQYDKLVRLPVQNRTKSEPFWPHKQCILGFCNASNLFCAFRYVGRHTE